MLIKCSLNDSHVSVDTNNNTFKTYIDSNSQTIFNDMLNITTDADYNRLINEPDTNTQSIFNDMLNITISRIHINNSFGGLLPFVKEIHNSTSYGLKISKDFTDILRMLRIIEGTNPISISNEIYSIKGISLTDLFYLIENNQDNITSGLRKFIRKKKMEKIMTNA